MPPSARAASLSGTTLASSRSRTPTSRQLLVQAIEHDPPALSDFQATIDFFFLPRQHPEADSVAERVVIHAQPRSVGDLHDHAEEGIAIARQMHRLRKHQAEIIHLLGRDTQSAVVNPVDGFTLSVGHAGGQRNQGRRCEEEDADLFAFQDFQGLVGHVVEIPSRRQRAVGETLGPAWVEINTERVHAPGLAGQFTHHFANDVRPGRTDPEPRLTRGKAGRGGDPEERGDERLLEFVLAVCRCLRRAAGAGGLTKNEAVQALMERPRDEVPDREAAKVLQRRRSKRVQVLQTLRTRSRTSQPICSWRSSQ